MKIFFNGPAGPHEHWEVMARLIHPPTLCPVGVNLTLSKTEPS